MTWTSSRKVPARIPGRTGRQVRHPRRRRPRLAPGPPSAFLPPGTQDFPAISWIFRASRLHKKVQRGDYRAVNPPTEQLIRDYLNRVSVAARGRLSIEDRQAFLARTREFIEQNGRMPAHAGTMGMARLLNGLGDPVALVDRECDRLAAQRAEAPDGTPVPDPRRPRLVKERRTRGPRGAWASRLRPPSADGPDEPAGDDLADGPQPAGTAAGGTAPGETVLGETVLGGTVLGGTVVGGTAAESAPGASRTGRAWQWHAGGWRGAAQGAARGCRARDRPDRAGSRQSGRWRRHPAARRCPARAPARLALAGHERASSRRSRPRDR